MPSAAFTTLGCKVNQYETQRILDSFSAAGFEIVPFDSVADVYVINTCSVTSIAESKSRYTIRKAAKQNPLAKIVVTGCAAQMALNKGEAIDGADVVVENPAKLETLQRLFAAFPEMKPERWLQPASRTAGFSLPGRTRATLKIQDGCNVLCSYCSIPFTRPVMTSRPAREVIEEARQMAEMGYREIVLTGVLIGAYLNPLSANDSCRGEGAGGGEEGMTDFEDLIELLQEELHDFVPVRLRISSIEMRQVTPRLIGILKRPHPVTVVPHLHIPLQAGDDQVLADMNRPYRRADYLALCERLYAEVPDMTITTDIMVGFPTESAEWFQSTVDVCESVRYLKIHAFRFSPRYGTPADAWGDPISPLEKQERSRVLAEISARTGSEHSARFLGRTMRVLVEGKVRDGLLEGLTDNYLTVRFAGPASLARQFAWVRLDEERGGELFGELAPAPLEGRMPLAVRA